MFSMMNRGVKRDEGFTLIELLVVVIILGILSAIVVFSVGNARDNAAGRACNANATQVLRALELYRASTGSYPTTDNTSVAVSTLTALVPGYLKSLPSSTDYSMTVKTNNTSGAVYVLGSSTITGFTCSAGTSF